MVESGRTKNASTKLMEWYNNEEKNADMEWEWGFNKEVVEKILDSRGIIPFKRYFMRYLLEIHTKEIGELLKDIPDNDTWTETSLNEILRIIDLDNDRRYEDSNIIIKKITDIVYSDFVSNGFYLESDVRNGVITKIRGSVNNTINKGKNRGKALTWDKEALKKKICSDRLNSDELFAFGFGLNMAFEDISFFLRKVLRRADFNLWNWEEFLLFITFKYAKGDLFTFYNELNKKYKSQELKPLKCDWMKDNNFSTVSIEKRMDAVSRIIVDRKYNFSLEPDGSLPGEIINFLGEYKYLIKNSDGYKRTVLKESSRMLADFKKYIGDDDKMARKKADVNMDYVESFSKGYVSVYYNYELGLNIPKGTKFYKVDKNGKKIEFKTQENVNIEPVPEMKIDVEIPVQCKKKTEKKAKKEDEDGYIEGKTLFKSSNSYLTEIHNKSEFKTPWKNLKLGDVTCVSGKIYAKCDSGKKIEKGTEFYPLNKEEKSDIVYLSTKDIESSVYAKIWVQCLVPGEEASKDEIIGCELSNWKEKFVKIENTKIGFTKKKECEINKGGVLYNYLYQTYDEELGDNDILDNDYITKLGNVLEGTQLSSTQISQITSQKANNVSRNDILTLSFLSYMSELEYKRIENDMSAEDDYSRYGEFISRTNNTLRKCGYYELYAPNPYDSLIMCLISSNEAINAYRNLWSWYLTNKERG